MSDRARLNKTYQDIKQMKKERKTIKDSWRDALQHDTRYQEVVEEMKSLREEKKRIEAEVIESSPRDAQKADELSFEIKSSEELVSDLALNLYMKDETVEIVDEYNNRYVPQFVVRFKKDGMAEE